MATDISWSTYDNIPVMVVGGRVIEQGNGELRTALDKLSGRATRVALDVTDVEFMDSHALGQIMFCNKSMKCNGSKLVLLNRNPDPSTYMGRMIDIANLGQVIELATSYEQL